MAENLYETIGTSKADNLIAGDGVKILTKAVTLAAGQGVLGRGSVLGIVSATDKAVLADSSAADGSETAKYVLADEVDTTSEDINAVVYESGLFNRQALIFGGTDTAEKHEDTLRQFGIFMKDNIAY